MSDRKAEAMDLGVDDVRPAVVAIDLHRGHLDPAVATMPVVPGSEARVIAANRRFLARCRAVGVPVVHLVTSYRDREEIRSNPFRRTRADDPTMNRPELHAAALACVRNAFGWVMSGDEALEHVVPAAGHRGEVASSFNPMTGSRS